MLNFYLGTLKCGGSKDRIDLSRIRPHDQVSEQYSTLERTRIIYLVKFLLRGGY
jgi:hypothetical protein